jgi:hypothetical protein
VQDLRFRANDLLADAVDPGTVQRISRPFAAPSVAAAVA